MSTIDEVRAAEKRVRELVDALRHAGALDPDRLNEKLKLAADEYAKTVRELEPPKH